MPNDIPHDLRLVATKAAKLSLRWQNVIPLDEAESLALEGVWRAMQKHDPDKSPIGPFAFLLATRQIKDDVLRERRQRKRSKCYQDPIETRELVDRVDDAMSVPSCERDQFWDVVDDALSPRQAEAVRLVYRDGLTQTEAARRLGMSHGGVHYAIKELRRKLKPVVVAWV